jgi:hemolysin activation/secretion protein
MSAVAVKAIGVVIFGLGLASAPSWVRAQSGPNLVPDAGSIQRDIQKSMQPKPPVQTQAIAVPSAAVAASGDVTFRVQRFDVQGAQLMEKTAMDAVLAPWLDRELDLSELRRVVPALEEAYLKQGWLARVNLPPQDIQDGVVRLVVSAGLMGVLDIVDRASLPISADRVEKTFGQAYVEGTPLNVRVLEGALNVVQALPGVNASASLKAGSVPNATDVVATVVRTPALDGSGSLDNWGHARTGSERASLNLSWNNPSAHGDQLSTNLMATSAVNYGRVAYSVPVAYSGSRLGLSFSQMRYQLLGGVNDPVVSGVARTDGVDWSRPLFYSRLMKVAASAQVSRSSYADTTNGFESQRQVQSGVLGLSGDWTSASRASFFWRLSWTYGDVDLSANPTNQKDDAEGLQTQGRYQKLNGSLTFVQVMESGNQLWLTLNGQRSLKNLDSSDRMSLGGAQGIRAYPSSEGSGDEAFTASLEWRIPVVEGLQWQMFYDLGTVRVSKHPAVENLPTPNAYGLSGWGAGFSYQVSASTVLKATAAHRIGGNPGARLSESGMVENDSSSQKSRYWINLVHSF